jgi:hypothetical protein
VIAVNAKNPDDTQERFLALLGMTAEGDEVTKADAAPLEAKNLLPVRAAC